MSKNSWRKLTWGRLPDRHAPPVVSRGYPQVLLEVIRQVALIGEARHERRDRWNHSVGQNLPCSLDADLDQILVWRQPGRCAKCTNYTEGGYSGPLGKRLKRSLIGFGVGVLEHIAYDTHDARLARVPAPRIQIRRALHRVATDQFRDRNADGLLSRRIVKIRRSICIARSA